ncbi:unnamed protein product [Amaranthus hypochondriacus]
MAMGFVLTMLKLCTVICFIIFQWTPSVISDDLQQGFISIDCGSNKTYTEESTTLYYTIDADYIDTGLNFDVSDKYKSSGLMPLMYTVRSFPEGNKNCYTLRPAQGRDTKYLIRVYFMYGNYDQLNKPPTFDLHLGVDVWDTIQLDNSSHILVKEIIHTLKTDYLYVCLANTGLGTPFISGLELRPLNNSIYKTDLGSLNLCHRYHTSKQSYVIRYKDDAFDRIWTSAYWPKESITQSTSEISSNLDAFSLPSSVMKAGIVPENVSRPIQLILNLNHGIDGNTEIFVFFHVTEFSKLRKGEVREFTITVNGIPFFGSFKPNYLEAKTIYNTEPTTVGLFVNILIERTSISTLPPVLNAIELYSLKRLSQLSTYEADVLAITNTKSFYKKMNDWQGDPCMPRSYSWSGVNCSYDTSESSRLISLNLSSKGLTGHIAASFADLTSLQILDLSNNNLTGLIPEFLADLPSLKTLNLAGNNLTGSVPELLLEKSAAGSLSLSVENNPGLCSSTSCTLKKHKKVPVALLAGIAAVVILLVTGFIILCMYKKKIRRNHARPAAGHPLKSVNSKGKGLFTQFTYSEITNMTRGFQRKLGEGGSAVVYYGCLNDGLEVAVKLLSATVHGSEQFRAEVELLMAIRHKNLVSLIGYCEEGSNRALVYEFMAAGNLHNLLLGSKSFGWKKRLQIAVDTAQGLEYLHNGCRPSVVHRDVKTHNILLNKTLEAKVADFGLSKIFPENNSHVLTRVIGTPGYLDPEYYITEQLHEKSDVYSYGVVLLELITGKAAVLKHRDRTSALSLVQWVISALDKGDLRHILDERLQEVENLNSVWGVIDIAMSCVKPTAAERPTMSQIVVDLKECFARVSEAENAARVPNDILEMSLMTSTTDMALSAR